MGMNNGYIMEDVKSINIDTCSIYEGSQLRQCTLGKNVVVGEDSYLKNAVLGDYVQIDRRNLIIDAVIGNRTFTGANTILRHAEIGKYSSISWNVSLGGGGRHHIERLSSHPFTQLKQFGLVDENEPVVFPKTIFGNDIWIGMGVAIIAGVKIGDGAVIGAGSVVTHDVPPYAVVAGCPAKILKYRFDDVIIERLLKLKWWDLPDDVIRDNISLFQHTLSIEDLDKLQDIAVSI